ncbi:hypothetical protein DH2020_022841 [Rehmannia glutinosa]|uniref:B box-type domain-containing protein n=1 Tax=Rehmannia glutinosa TaxID=99300 RepID=A0ABR0W4B7_REHGL
MHCVSDQASLCWECDAMVHSANFLVARHSRNLLCRVCQGPTPWSASGAKLGPTTSVCEQCVDERSDESSEEESEGEQEEVVEENQVVPWSPPPAAESSSSIEETMSGREDVAVSRKRLRIGNASSNLQSDDDEICSSSFNICTQPPSDSALRATDSSFSRRETTPMREFLRTEPGRAEACGSGILDSLRRFHREEMGSDRKRVEFFTFL